MVDYVGIDNRPADVTAAYLVGLRRLARREFDESRRVALV
jgi:hypothetical protein